MQPTGHEEVWYGNRCLGVNKLVNMMKELSLSAQLSKIYTNHCVRLLPLLSGRMQGYQTATLWQSVQAIAMSNHLQSYNSRPSSNQLQQCSNVLSRALNRVADNQLQVVQENHQVQSSFMLHRMSSQGRKSPTLAPCSVAVQSDRFTFHSIRSMTIKLKHGKF